VKCLLCAKSGHYALQQKMPIRSLKAISLGAKAVGVGCHYLSLSPHLAKEGVEGALGLIAH
jgi:isopentenyl diphosphate isomerase/L-lactate dehydrogenase-like FMN-dependent dehydrogenase